MPESQETSATESSSPDAGTAAATTAGQRPGPGLRMWPALLLVAIAWLCRLLPGLLQNASFPALMLQFMGPLACAGLLVLWWLLLSRAQGYRIIGLVGLVAIAAVSTLVSEKSMAGFGTMIYAIPWGATAFALGLWISGWGALGTGSRTCWGLACAVLGFGFWSLVRIDEIRGDFQTTRSWRWEPTAEDRFLEQLSATPASDTNQETEQTAEDLLNPEWAAFRGPQRNGHQPGVQLNEDWAASPPKELWRIPVGPAWSSFSVAGDRIFTQEQRGESEVTVCYDANNGKPLWVYEYPSRFWEVVGGAGPRATPTIDGGSIFALGANGHLHCLDAIRGNEIWKRNIGEDAGREPPQWGFSSSPLVTDNLVVVHAGGPDSKGTLAYNKQTGEPQWEAPAGDHSYSSPQLSTICGQSCILMLTNQELALLDPVTGTIMGSHSWPFQQYRVVQPLVLDESTVLLGTAMGVGTRRVNLQWDGEKFSSSEQWTSRRMAPYYNDFVAHKGYLYGFDNNVFACIDLESGKRKWKRGRYGNGQVLLLPDADQLLVTSEDGELILLRTNPDKLTEVAKHRVLEGRTWNHPVLVDNRLYVRNAEEAACFEMPMQSNEQL